MYSGACIVYWKCIFACLNRLGIETILISYCIDLNYENKPPRQYKFIYSLAKAAGQKNAIVKIKHGAHPDEVEKKKSSGGDTGIECVHE